jgi:autotransporter passenger strand-loop-strand repeat protein
MTTFTVSSGQTSVGLTLNSGDLLFVLDGGIAIDTTVITGTEVVNSGGIASGTMVEDSGVESVDGIASGTVVKGSGSVEGVAGIAIGTVVSSGGEQNVGGIASSTVVSSGGTEDVASGGTAINTRVLDGGQQVVFAGGTTSGSLLSGSTTTIGEELVEGGAASGTIVDQFGVLFVSAGGLAVNTAVGKQGTLSVQSGGVASGMRVITGLAHIESGGVASGGVVSGAGQLLVESGGFVQQTTILGFAVMRGSASSVIVGNSGIFEVQGETSGTLVRSGGEEEVFPGDQVTSTTIQKGGVKNFSNKAFPSMHSTTGLKSSRPAGLRFQPQSRPVAS